MPKRSDIETILIIGAGPIVIGQACEFDYSGTQACKALREEGYRIVLVNSNPATIMTDPDLAHATYIEPIQWQVVAEVIAKERPCAILPTMGGQTALNCAIDLDDHGVLAEFGVEMIGANRVAIDKAEDRGKFREAMKKIGLKTVGGQLAHSLDEAEVAIDKVGFPAIIRPSFTMGGSGGGVAYNREEFMTICRNGLELSPTSELLIERSIHGWKEFEMEVVRDRADNCIIICSIENLDPMGLHTGDSITVAPAQTLTDKEYQLMRDASVAVLREIGVDTGGSNVQFAVNPADGEMVVIEMNPRVSRSSALASKATGFPIAKVAARLAVGYTLDELANEITGGRTPASFEPAIDYVVTKVPRFDFEKFPEADASLTTQMKSVGEVMAIGRTFHESLQKALRGLEIDHYGFEPEAVDGDDREHRMRALKARVRQPLADRLWFVAQALRDGLSVVEVHQLCKIDPWFLDAIAEIVETEEEIAHCSLDNWDMSQVLRWKRLGFADRRLAELVHSDETQVRQKRHALGVRPVFKRVDSCAAEFETTTAYLYSTYEEFCEAEPTTKKKIMVLGGGPNRIGQGIEFDYCCVHAAMALREDGYETIMVNCNPETVSTDYDTSDRLYFEPLTLEDVLEIVHVEQPAGVIVQLGGQTPLKLARELADAGVPVIGTSPEAIHRAEDRENFQQLLQELGLRQPPNRIAVDTESACAGAADIGYPLVVRPSYVLGGRAMEIVYSDEQLRHYMTKAIGVSNDSPVLLDRFLDDAIEVDVDAVCDTSHVAVGGIMEHIEQAGVHSGDSACSLPPFSLPAAIQAELRDQTRLMALALGVRGLMNVQFAVKDNDIYVLEVNPRASRTVPFVSKATGVSLAKVAARVMSGRNLSELGVETVATPGFYSVKEAVFPFVKFPGVDTILGPEMKSTGEVMGVGEAFGAACARSFQAAGMSMPASGCVLISVRDDDQEKVTEIAHYLSDNGFEIVATRGTAKVLKDNGLDVKSVNKVKEGRPHVVDLVKNDEINLIVNTTEGQQSLQDSYTIRREALNHRITYFTTLAAARAACEAHRYNAVTEVNSLQSLHGRESARSA